MPTPVSDALGIGAVLPAAVLAGFDIAPRLPGVLVGVVGAFAAGSAWVFELVAVDAVDPGAGAVIAFIFAGLAVYSLGLVMFGARLKGE